jgi:predicted nicotinamide N-methyase
VTDLHAPTLDNLGHNIALNGLPTATGEEQQGTESLPLSASPVIARYVNWCDPATYPAELADVIVGSDLVYDSAILAVLVPAVVAMLREGLPFISCLSPHPCLPLS